MSLDRSLLDLHDRLAWLQEALEELSTTIEEDRPPRGDVVVAARLSDSILALRGLAAESAAAVNEVNSSRGASPALALVARTLAAAQKNVNRFQAEMRSDVMAYERLEDLMMVARERGRDWADWVTVVRRGCEQATAQVEEVSHAILLCWIELVERLDGSLVSIQNTCIGQSTVPRFQGGDAGQAEGVDT